jgi:hypothetical protein
MTPTYTRNDASTNTVLRVVGCRKCRAAVGKLCRTKSGNVAQWVHEIRIDDYLLVAEGIVRESGPAPDKERTRAGSLAERPGKPRSNTGL